MKIKNWAENKGQRAIGSLMRSVSGVFAASVFLLGCSTAGDITKPVKKLFGTDEQIFVSSDIQKNYDPHVIMKRAESFYDQEAYPEAIVEYQHFLDMHRQHKLASYAQYKQGQSYFKMAKTIDRDPEPIEKALDSYEKLLHDFPGSKWETDALVKVRECKNWLARVNFFVGRFYYRRGSYLAAAHRFEEILKQETDVEVKPDALYYLALTYRGIGAHEWAQENLTLLAQKYPGNEYEEDAMDLLAELNADLPPVAYAQTSPQTIEQIGVPVAALNGEAGSSGLSGSSAAFTQSRLGSASVLRSVRSNIPSLAPKACRIGTWC